MTAPSSVLDLGVAALASAIARGEVTSEAAVAASLDRIAALDPNLNAFIAVERAEALEKARAVDKARTKGVPPGPLAGVPLAHKDMFWRAGKVMTGGSAILEDFRPQETATSIRRLEAAGAITIGRLNMSEFAASPTGTNIRHGYARNPYDTKRAPGGSSSGSGVAVAARMIPGALGSDTGGSIRIPAAINGIVGLKPTWGRLSMHGTMPRAFSLDVVGPMARHAADTLLMLSVTAGPDPLDASSAAVPAPAAALPPLSPRQTKIAIAAADSLGEVAPAVLASVDRAAKALGGEGFPMRTVAVPNLPEYHALGDAISKSEAATLHRRWMIEHPEAYSRLVYDRTLAGLMVPAVRYIEALSLRGKLTAAFLRDVLGEAEALLLPVVTMETPTIAELEERDARGEFMPVIAGFTRLCRWVNYLGLPSVSVPCGTDRDGLPIGFQLVGRPMAEASLLAIADHYERHVGFGLPKLPPVLAPSRGLSSPP